jgi:HEAT repeat protein
MSSLLTAPADRLAALEAAARGPGGEQHILAALEDAAPSVRDRAIRLAARYVEPAVLGELVADGENAVRRNAGLTALERQGPYAVPHLVAMLGRDDAELVLFALQSLSRIGSAPAGPAILPLLHHPDPNVAQAAIEAVGKLRVSEAVPALCGLLQRDLWLQLAAIAALGEIGHPAAVGPLMAFVPDSVLAEPAVQALRRIAAPESLEPLLPLLLAVRERALRDPLLLAVAVVIDLHPDPAPLMSRVERDVVVDGGNLVAYLGQLLAATPDAEDGEETESLLRAAATMVAAAGIAELQPMLLARLAKDTMAQWIEGLMARFPERVAPHLRALLEHPDPDVRCGALRVGSFGPGDLSAVVAHLSDPQLAVRTAACLALGRMGIDAAAPLLLERLRRGEPPEQAAAAQGLARLSPEALGEIESCLEPGTAEPVMVEALAVLARTPVPALEPRILQLTESPSAALRLAALRAAAPVAGAKSEVVLLRALADRHQPIQTEALELLVRRAGDRSVTTMVALLGSADSLRFHVIRALGHCRAQAGAARLRDLYPECGPHEQLQIVWSLLRIAPPWLSQFLLLRLAEPDLDMRRAAAQGLSDVAGFDHLPVLLALADDADWDIRNSAARGLGRIGTPETRTALLTLARDVESVVAATARAALEQPSRDAAPRTV